MKKENPIRDAIDESLCGVRFNQQDLSLIHISLFCRLFNLTAEATDMCEQVLRWFAVFSIFFWATSFTLPNALRAGGDAKFTMAVSMVSMWLFRVMLCYVFVQSFHMGLLGVWLGMFIDWICRSLLFLIRFVRGRWIEHQVI